MVRLKDIDQYVVFNPKTFQFHYGTIKSSKTNLPYIKIEGFQFHYGTIKRRLDRMTNNALNDISIPLWYD